MVLREGVEDTPDNVTRFVWIAPAGTKPAGGGPWRTTLVFSELGADHPGALVEALTEFSSREVNLTRIESRPRRQGLGRYMFFIDLDGAEDEPAVAEAIEALRDKAESVRILGSYPVGCATGSREARTGRGAVYNRGAMDTPADPHVGLQGARAPEPERVAPPAGDPSGNGQRPSVSANGHRLNGHRPHVAIGGRVLVLNASYEPINVCNVRRATVLVLKERAEVLERGEGALHSERLAFDRPCVIRLIRYIRIPRDVHRRKITRKAVLARDAWTCQYCGRQAHRPHRRPRDPAQPRRPVGVGEHRRLVRPLQPEEGEPHAAGGTDAPPQPAAAPGADRLHPPRQPEDPDAPGSPTWRPHSEGPPRGAALRQGAVGSEMGIGGGAGLAPRLPYSPVPGVDSPGGPHGPPSGPAPPVSRETCDSS